MGFVSKNEKNKTRKAAPAKKKSATAKKEDTVKKPVVKVSTKKKATRTQSPAQKKAAKVAAEKRKLLKIFQNLPENKKKLCDKLIGNAAFMAATLDDLQKRINEDGSIITAPNGNGFEITQEHPAQKSYNAMMGNYKAVINQLTALLPDQKADNIAKAGENLARLVAGGKPVEIR